MKSIRGVYAMSLSGWFLPRLCMLVALSLLASCGGDNDSAGEQLTDDNDQPLLTAASTVQPGSYSMTGRTSDVTIGAAGVYTVSGSSTKYRIGVATTAEVVLILDNADISLDGVDKSPFSCGDYNCTVTVLLKGKNHLKAAPDFEGAALRVSTGQTVNIRNSTENAAGVIGSLEAIGGDSRCAIGAQDFGTLNIYGGEVTAFGGPDGSGIGGAGGSITISDDAVVTATGGESGAGIGGGNSQDGGSVIIKGNAVVTAIGGEDGAGIGGGDGGNGGPVTISGNAVVTAAGGYDPGSTIKETGAAGIGGGSKGDSGTVNITGDAVVTATGSAHSGAGIGGGYNGDAGPVTISENAFVTATGGNLSAGIGGGPKGNGGPVTISGGTVHAQGGGCGAGIGGGAEKTGGGEGGPFTMTSGTVYAYGTGDAGYDGGAGVGGGYGGRSDSVIIQGGWLYALGGTGGAGIGGGQGAYALHDGEKIRITGGTVTAVGNHGGAGIGGGEAEFYLFYSGGKGGDVEISGGSVNAVVWDPYGSSLNANGKPPEAIGHGRYVSDSGTLTNGYGQDVALLKVGDVFTQTMAAGREPIPFAVQVAKPDKTTYTYGYNGIGHLNFYWKPVDEEMALFFYLPAAEKSTFNKTDAMALGLTEEAKGTFSCQAPVPPWSGPL